MDTCEYESQAITNYVVEFVSFQNKKQQINIPCNFSEVDPKVD